MKMAHREIIFHKRKLTIHKASISPDITQPSVLVKDTWDFVDLWLQRNAKGTNARFYWEQAKNFYSASLNLPKTSSPLTLYYCYLNAVKTLLVSKKIQYGNQHGLTGKFAGSSTTLENEIIKLKFGGVLPKLAEYLGSPINNKNNNLNLFDCFYNLPFLHRSFLLTYRSNQYPELFLPIHTPLIVKSMKNNEAWFCAIVDELYTDTRTINSMLPRNFEHYSENGKLIIRCKKRPSRIRWSHHSKESEKIKNFINYNNKIRKLIYYIHGTSISWYLKKDKNNNTHHISLPPLVLMFSAMHRLSELARYEPDKLANHFKCKQN